MDFLSPLSRWLAVRGKEGWGWVPAPRLRGGGLFAGITGGCTPILTFPPEGGRGSGGRGFVLFCGEMEWEGEESDEKSRLRFAALGVIGCPLENVGWVPAFARTRGDGWRTGNEILHFAPLRSE